jgi:hypothetical protein
MALVSSCCNGLQTLYFVPEGIRIENENKFSVSLMQSLQAKQQGFPSQLLLQLADNRYTLGVNLSLVALNQVSQNLDTPLTTT